MLPASHSTNETIAARDDHPDHGDVIPSLVSSNVYVYNKETKSFDLVQLACDVEDSMEGDESDPPNVPVAATTDWRGKVDSIRRLFDSLPELSGKRLESIVKLHREFHSRTAAALQPVIDDLLRNSLPPTYVDKQALATAINDVLRDIGLAVAHPETHEPCTVVAVRSSSAPNGWLLLQQKKKDADGNQVRTSATTKLDTIRLRDFIREEAFSRRGRS